MPDVVMEAVLTAKNKRETARRICDEEKTPFLCMMLDLVSLGLIGTFGGEE